NRPASAIPEPVAGLRIAEPFGHVAGRLIFFLLSRRSPDLLHKPQFSRFMSELGQEGRRAQRSVNLINLHDFVYERQVKLALGLWQPRHNLLQIAFSQHYWSLLNGSRGAALKDAPSFWLLENCVWPITLSTCKA